jgi:MFS transporter, FSR family, fosmidomycin resistance protein
MTTDFSPARTARVALAFSCLGHAYSHLFAPIFYVVVLTLEHEFTLTHGAAVALIVVGNVL